MDYHPTEEPKNKMSPIVTGPYKVTEANDTTRFILMEDRTVERITLYRVVLAPEPDKSGTPESLTDTKISEDFPSEKWTETNAN